MSGQKITNEVLYELLKEFKADTQRQFQQVQQQFQQIEKRLDRLEENQYHDRRMLMEIWESRDKVVAKVTWDFIWKSLSCNAIILIFMIFIVKFA